MGPRVHLDIIKDAIMNIGIAWEGIDEQLCHKCLENIRDTNEFMRRYNEKPVCQIYR